VPSRFFAEPVRIAHTKTIETGIAGYFAHRRSAQIDISPHARTNNALRPSFTPGWRHSRHPMAYPSPIHASPSNYA
jgi:hypothetical protein